MPIASLKPLRKTAPRRAIRDERDGDLVAFEKAAGTNGFSSTCAVASAAERVMVTMKSVATNPSSTRTKSLPCHHGEQPLQHRDGALAVRAFAGDAAVDRQRAEQGQQHEDERGEGREQPAASAAMPGW